MSRVWELIGAPSSAGAHTPGVEKGPAALRAAGLLTALAAHAQVTDGGDVEGFRWRPDRDDPRAQNASEVARVARLVAERVRDTLERGRLPLVIGGDCTVTLGLVAGLSAMRSSTAMVYIDAGPDLFTPRTRANGNLDAMGLAHLLGLPGTVAELVDLDRTGPVLQSNQVILVGDSLQRGDHEDDVIEELGLARVPASQIHLDPPAAARQALDLVRAAATEFVVHLDADVMAFLDVPLSDVPEPSGLQLDEVVTILRSLVASSGFAGLALTEVNPDHVPDEHTLPRFVSELASALALS